MSKSILTYQIEGRLGSYIEAIDDCPPFKADSKLCLDRTMEMPEAIHGLLKHTQQSLMNEMFDGDYKLEHSPLYSLEWQPDLNKQTLSGIIKIIFNVPDRHYFTNFQFRSVDLTTLAETVIKLMKYSLETDDKRIELPLYIIKKKASLSMSDIDKTLLKNEIIDLCPNYASAATYIFDKYKETNGHFASQYANFSFIE